MNQVCMLNNNKKTEKQQKINEAFGCINDQLASAGIEMYLKQA